MIQATASFTVSRKMEVITIRSNETLQQCTTVTHLIQYATGKDLEDLVRKVILRITANFQLTKEDDIKICISGIVPFEYQLPNLEEIGLKPLEDS